MFGIATSIIRQSHLHGIAKLLEMLTFCLFCIWSCPTALAKYFTETRNMRNTNAKCLPFCLLIK